METDTIFWKAYDKLKGISLARMQKDLTSGRYLGKTKRDESVWIILDHILKPQYVKFSFHINGVEYKELYRDKNNCLYLKLPFIKPTYDNSGFNIAYNNVLYANSHLNLASNPNVVMVGCYESLPEYIKYKGKRYIPMVNNKIPYSGEMEYNRILECRDNQIQETRKISSIAPKFVLQQETDGINFPFTYFAMTKDDLVKMMECQISEIMN